MDDHQIIDLYFLRSEQAIAETDAKYGHYCFRIAQRILDNREDSEESVSDTYLAVWQAVPPTRPPSLSLYLGRITRNLAIDRWRERHADKRGGQEFCLCLEELQDCVSGENGVELNEIQKEIAASLNRFLHAQTALVRKVFLRRYWYMDSIPEIAEAFGISQTNVTTILYRTRKKLYKQLKKEELL